MGLKEFFLSIGAIYTILPYHNSFYRPNLMTQNKEGTKNALIAEDNNEDFQFFSNALDKISVKVILTRAEDGEILIRLLDEIEINPDVLFLDLLLPIKDGRECLKLIRKNKKFDLMPIVIYSNPKEYESIEFCYR